MSETLTRHCLKSTYFFASTRMIRFPTALEIPKIDVYAGKSEFVLTNRKIHIVEKSFTNIFFATVTLNCSIP